MLGHFGKHATAPASTVGGIDEATDRPSNHPDRRSYRFVPGGPAPLGEPSFTPAAAADIVPAGYGKRIGFMP